MKKLVMFSLAAAAIVIAATQMKDISRTVRMKMM
jgi:hypothetical protein